MRLTSVSLLLLALVIRVKADPLAPEGKKDDRHPDLIVDLPGLTFTPAFKQYSGYLNGTDGRRLHYWFVESERSPSEDPLVLWLNGGPGCSSLLGLLTEQGPYRINRSDPTQLLPNDFRWNKVANVLFLEAPAGVGFSYRENSEDYETSDDQTAKDNHEAIRSFFLKFPQFKSNAFFVTGESYAGIYVPTLATQILRNSPDINLQGFAIGNGYLDEVMLGDSLILFGYFHGVYGRTVWSNLVSSCCHANSTANHTSLDPVSMSNGCRFTGSKDKACRAAVDAAAAAIKSNDINIYNLYKKCDFPEEEITRLNNVHDRLYANVARVVSREQFDRRLVIKSLGQKVTPQVANALKDTPPCIDDSFIVKYVNQKSVRSALHVPTHVKDWQSCSEDVESTYQNQYRTVKPLVLELLKAGKRGLIYNGDVDMACNFLGDQWFVDDLGLTLVSDYKEWHLQNQAAGYVKHFENLAYATVKGAGHMVPDDKPAAALALIVGFLE